MKPSILLFGLILIFPPVEAGTPVPSIGAENTIFSNGSGRVFVQIPAQASLTNVSIQQGDGTLALMLSGARTFMFLRWPTGSFPDSLGDSCCTFPPGNYHLYIVSRAPVTMTLRLEGLAGRTTLTLAPSGGEVHELLPLFPTSGVVPATIKNHSFSTPMRSALVIVETSDIISGPGATVISSTHSVRNQEGEADCQPNGKVFVVLNALGGTGTRIRREFVKDAGVWDLQVSYAAPGTGVTLAHTAYGIAVPIDNDDPLQGWTNPVWRILFEAPGADAVNPKHRERAQNLVCAALANP